MNPTATALSDDQIVDELAFLDVEQDHIRTHGANLGTRIRIAERRKTLECELLRRSWDATS